MYVHIHSNPWNKSFIFCWKFSGELLTLIGRRIYWYFTHDRIIVHKLLESSVSRVWQYSIFASSDVAYLKPSNLNNISLVLCIGYGLRFNFIFKFLKSLIKRNRFVLGLGCAKDGAPHSGSFALSRNPSRTKHSDYSFNVYSYIFGTGYGLENIGFAVYFSSKSTGSVF